MNNNFNLNALIRPNIKNLQPYSSARSEYNGNRTHTLFLDANENPFETEVNRYPDPNQTQLKQVLALKNGVSTSQIVLGNGSDEILDLLFRAFCTPNQDNVIVLPPTYGMYTVLAHINAINVTKINLNTNFQPNVNAILKAQNADTKLLFLCSPNNPTGNTIPLQVILQLLDNFKGIVVLDEAYIHFTKTESAVALLAKYPNLVVIQTLSKAFGMAGVRLGICYASTAITSVLNRIKPPYNVNSLTQNLAIKCLENTSKITAQIQAIVLEKDRLINALQRLPFVVKIYPSETNFIMVKVDNATLRYKQLIDAKIIVRLISNKPLCSNCLRFTIGTNAQNNLLINQLKTLV